MSIIITQLAAVGPGHIFRPVPDTLTAGLLGENAFLRNHGDHQRLIALGLSGWYELGEAVQIPAWELVRCAVSEPKPT